MKKRVHLPTDANEAIELPKPWTLADFLGLAAAIMIPFVCYILCLAPGVVIEGDSGEIISAVDGFGIIHSPGFPGYVMLAKFFTLILGWLSSAVALNLFSAVGGAISSGLIFVIVRRWAPPINALLASFCLAFSAEFFYASVATEVYSWALAFVLLPFALLSEVRAARAKAFAWAIGLAVGWGIATHVYIWASLPLMGFWGWRTLKRQEITLSKKHFAYGLILGLVPFLYLPLRAGKFNWVNEGGIDSLSSLLDHVTWNLQRQRVLSNEQSGWLDLLSVRWQQLSFYAECVAKQWGPVGAVWTGLLIATLWLKFRRHPEAQPKSPNRLFFDLEAVAHAGATLMPGLILFVFSARHFVWSDVGENSVHLITFYTYLALVLGLGMARLHQRWQEGFRKVSWALVVIAGIGLPYRALQNFNLSTNQIAHAHADDLVSALAPDAVFIGDGDNDLMPVVHLLAVEKVRPDVSVFNLANNSRWYYQNTRNLFGHLQWPDYSPLFLLQLVRLNQARPIYFSNFFAGYRFIEASGFKAEWALVPIHGAFRLVRAGENFDLQLKSEVNRAIALKPEVYRFQLRPREADVIAQRADYFLRLGEFWRSRGELALARTALDRGLSYQTLSQTEFGKAILEGLVQSKSKL